MRLRSGRVCEVFAGMRKEQLRERICPSPSPRSVAATSGGPTRAIHSARSFPSVNRLAHGPGGS